MKTQCLLFCSAIAVLSGVTNTAAHAEPLTFQDVSVANAAAQIGAKYGVGVNLRGLGGVRVTFSVDDADAADARLQAVNALANAAGADFTKTYVISQAVDGITAPARVDATASLPSSQKAYPAREAIDMVAGLDDAAVRFTDATAMDGTVTLTGSLLTVAQAAAQIAQQTHTRWGTVYTLEPRLTGRVPGGTVIGHTSGGSAIVQLASVYYHDAAWTTHQKGVDEAVRQEALAEQQAALAEQQAEQAALAQQAAASGQRAGVGRSTPAGYGSYGTGNGYGISGGTMGTSGQGNGSIVIGGQTEGNNIPPASGGGY